MFAIVAAMLLCSLCTLTVTLFCQEQAGSPASSALILQKADVRRVGVVASDDELNIEVFYALTGNKDNCIVLVVIQRGTKVIKQGGLNLFVDGKQVFDVAVGISAVRPGEVTVINVDDKDKRFLKLIEQAPKGLGGLPIVKVSTRIAILAM